jgi:hypothetical protein
MYSRHPVLSEKEKKMKKMVMMTAVLLVAGMAQAAAVVWNTGKLYTPGPDGSFGGEINASTDLYFATVTFFLDAGGSAGGQITGVTGITDSTSVALSDALNGTTSGYEFAVSTKYWAQVSIVSAAIDGNYYSMTSALVELTIPGVGSGSVNFSSSLPTRWEVTPVPEPTGMALLALGIAAVGLRRRFRK